MLGRHRGVVLMNDLLVATFGFKLLLRDTGKLQRRSGGAGGNRLQPELLLLLVRILRTGVFGREMEVLCSVAAAAAAATTEEVVVALLDVFVPDVLDEDADELSRSCELSLEEEQLKGRGKLLVK